MKKIQSQKKWLLLLLMMLNGGCNSEYPSEKDEQFVFRSEPVKIMTGSNVSVEGQYLIGQVISASGKISYIKNTGGQPAIQIDDMVVCAFGSRFRKPISKLKVGDTVKVKGLLDSINRAGVYMTPCVFVGEPSIDKID